MTSCNFTEKITLLDAQQGCQLGCKTLPNFFDTFEMQNPPKKYYYSQMVSLFTGA